MPAKRGEQMQLSLGEWINVSQFNLNADIVAKVRQFKVTPARRR
jgi:hypothetical protein